MKRSKNPNDIVRFFYDILYEKYKSQIAYTPTIPTNQQHLTLNEVENENLLNEEENQDTVASEENSIEQMNKNKAHQKAKSDASGMR